MDYSLVYKLDQPLNAQKVLEDIQKLINNFMKQTDSVPLLVVSIKTISYEDSSHIRNIEYKSQGDCTT